jgi:hypothetical protein
VLGALIWIGLARRTGRVAGLAAVEGLAARSLRLPGWSALPVLVCAGSLICAVFGLYWDVSLHIDNGRDAGPLANPAHYFILVGLLGIFAAGWLAVVLPRERPGPSAVRITRDWYAPVGGVVMMACASFAALGFPLDDLWHRLFGQDVTLWGPTHMMMLTGAALTLVGILVLMAEGRRARGDAPARAATGDGHPWYAPGWLVATRTRLILAAGGLLVGLSIYQGEFDFGVPQYRMLFHPALIALAAAGALVAARLMAGKGAALGAALFFIVLRGGLTLLVHEGLGRSVSHFPLYLAEAALVEGLALWLGTRRPMRLALASGAAVGTAGVLAEWGWSHVWMPLAWPAGLLPGAVLVAVPVAMAAGALGAVLAEAVRPGRAPVAVASRRRTLGAVAAVAVVAVALGALLPTSVPSDARAVATLNRVDGPNGPSVQGIVRVRPSDTADGANWFSEFAWQGHGQIVSSPLKEVAPGTFLMPEPLPAHGSWKSVIRLQRGAELASVPVYLPADRAIPVPGVAAALHFSRPFQADHHILQRERRTDVPGWLFTAATVAVMATILGLVALLGWALRRLGPGGSQPPPTAAPVAPRVGRARAGVA